MPCPDISDDGHAIWIEAVKGSGALACSVEDSVAGHSGRGVAGLPDALRSRKLQIERLLERTTNSRVLIDEQDERATGPSRR
jgi:hypothetical protein